MRKEVEKLNLAKISKESGHVDLRNIKKDELIELKSWFEDNFDELEENDQLEFLEQLVGQDQLNDQEAFNFVTKLSTDLKAEFGTYLIRLIDTTRYPKCLQACWKEIKYQDRAEFMETAEDDPRKFGAVLPFNNLGKMMAIDLEGLVKRSQKVRKKAPIENGLTIKEQLKRFDILEIYVKSMIDYYRQFKPEQQEMIINNLEQVNPHYLLAFVDELIELDLWPESKSFDSLFQDDFESPMIPFDSDFNNEDDYQEKSRLEEKVQALSQGAISHPFFTEYNVRGYLSDSEYLKYLEINDRAKQKKAEVLFGKFSYYQEKISGNKNDLILGAVIKDVVVFDQIDKLGLKKDELYKLLQRILENEKFPFYRLDLNDLKKVCDFNRERKAEVGKDIEELIVRSVISSINEEDYNSLFLRKELKYNLKIFFDCFEPGNQEKIISAINAKIPLIWLRNLDFAIASKKVPLEEVFEELMNNSFFIFYYYDEVVRNFREQTKKGIDLPIGEAELNSMVKDIFLTNEAQIFSKVEDHRKIAEKIFTEDEIKAVIEEQLKNPDARFIANFLQSDNKFLPNYVDKFKRVVRRDTNLFVGIAETEHKFCHAWKPFTNKESIEMWLKSLDVIKADLIGDEGHLEEIGGSEAYPQEIIKQIKKFERFDICAQLLEGLDVYLKKEEELRNEMKHYRAGSYGANEQLYQQAKFKLDEFCDRPDHQLVKENLIQFRNQLVSIMRQGCEQNRFLAFSGFMTKAKGVDFVGFLKKNIKDYLKIDLRYLLAGEFREGYPRFDKLLESVLGKAEYEDLLRDNMRQIAFSRGKYGLRDINSYEISLELVEEVKKINPIYDIETQKKLEKDYYQTVLEIISGLPFFELYKEELIQIASEKNEQFGDVLDVQGHNIDLQFKMLADKVVLLSNSQELVANRDWIMSLAENKKRKAIEIFETTLINGWDESIRVGVENHELEEIESALGGKISQRFKDFFKIDDVDEEVVSRLSIKMQKAMTSYYFDRAVSSPQLKIAFRDFLSHVLQGDYVSWRAFGEGIDPNNQSEIETGMENMKHNNWLPKEIDIGTYKIWSEDNEIEFSEAFDYSIEDIKFGINQVIEQAIADQHVKRDDIVIENAEALFQNLIGPLKVMTERQAEIKKKGKKTTAEEKSEYKNIQNEIINYRQKHQNEIEKFTVLRYLDAIKKITVDDLQNQVISLEGKNKFSLKKSIDKIKGYYEEQYPDFVGDIERIRIMILKVYQDIFGEEKVSKSRITITDKVDPEVHMLIGEEPVPSCQSYAGGGYNQGLISYLVEPGVKIIQMYNQDGKIIARSIMRLIEDGEGKPAIFVERTYSSSPHPKISAAMERFAKKKAVAMNCRAYSTEVRGGGFTTLVSRGGRSPFTYSDAGGGLLTNNQYQVPGAKEIV
jgi:thymidylate synthase ThyX